ncbi:AMP-binding protein [Thermodesulfobacteriota bacterium]
MGLHDFTFYDLINRNAACFKEKEAWLEAGDGRTLTFVQLKKNVDRLAFGLRKSGIKKGDRVGVLGNNSLEYFLLYGAAAALGAILLPINWRLSPDEVEFNLNDCEPRLLFVDQEYQESVEGFKGNLASVEGYFDLGQKGNFSGFESLMENQGDFEREDISSDYGFVLMYTAAVAGRPRGALLSHGNVICSNMNFVYFLNLRGHDVHLNFVPLFHVGGLFMAFSSFQAGALNVNLRKFDAAKTVQLIEEKKVSVMMTFSPILSSVLEEHEKAGRDISSLRAVPGIETVETIEKYQKVTGGRFYNMYGQTETSCMTSFAAHDDRPGSVGKVIPVVEISVVDDYDRPVPVGRVGEITLRGPMVFKGYWNLPNDTEYTFRDGWHHTGDQGRLDDDGFLWYEGPKAEKELIKPGGENVYPAEVEKVILKHPAIDRTAVFGVPDPKWKEGVKAVCLLKEGESLEARELIDFVGECIAGFKKPQYVEFVANFPVLEDNSPDRARIKELYGGPQ